MVATNQHLEDIIYSVYRLSQQNIVATMFQHLEDIIYSVYRLSQQNIVATMFQHLADIILKKPAKETNLHRLNSKLDKTLRTKQ